MCDEIGCRQVAFIAGGDDMTEGQTQRAAAVEDRKAEAAALRDHGDATGRVRQCPFRLQGLRCGAKSRGDTADDVVKTLAIRPANADAGPARDLREPGLEFCPVAALFGESGRDNDRRANAGRGTLLDDVAYQFRRQRDDREVDRKVHRADRGIARQAVDFAVAGVDRSDPPLEPRPTQHKQQHAADRALLGRCSADNGDRPW